MVLTQQRASRITLMNNMFNSPRDKGEGWKKAAVEGMFKNSHDGWSNEK